MGIVSNLALIDTLRQTQLLSKEQIDRVTDQFSNRLVDARTLAKNMLQEGWLTVYQINQLLAGQGRQLVIGSYRVLDRLGHGGQSTVYKAQHRQTGKVVALKVIKTELLANPAAAEQFVQEMDAMASLDHPHVVKFLEANRLGDFCFCAMEFVEGTDLGKYTRLAGPLPASEACDYIHQAALGLQHAHERNLIHRDIKPQNILLIAPSLQTGGHDCQKPKIGSMVKILDWGLAGLRPPKSNHLECSPSSNKLLIGTADYLSPEQAIDPDGVDIRGDIYSLGCTFYFLLAGHPPFPDGKVMQKILAHQKVVPPRIDQIRDDLPLGLVTLVKRMLAKKPGDRYQTPAAVALALKPFRTDSRFRRPTLRGNSSLSDRESNQNPAPLPRRQNLGSSSSSSTFSSHIKDDTMG